MSHVLQEEIRQLSVAEKVLLVDELWGQIAVESKLSLEQREELDLRYEEFLKNPGQGASWAVVKDRLIQ